jgi:hypothetical protein
MNVGRLTHFKDISGPGFEVTHGKYVVLAVAPNGGGVTATISF